MVAPVANRHACQLAEPNSCRSQCDIRNGNGTTRNLRNARIKKKIMLIARGKTYQDCRHGNAGQRIRYLVRRLCPFAVANRIVDATDRVDPDRVHASN